MTTDGRKFSRPVTSDATSIGAAEMGATLKRRRTLVSRSCTARIPAPKNPLPKTPMPITIVKTWMIAPPCSAWNNCAKMKKNTSGNR